MVALLSAAEAARQPGVSRQTLYAYVSRGLLRAHAAEDTRQRRYDAAAVARLAAEHGRGRKPKDVAKATLDWGTPVLESAIAAIRNGRLWYRGVDAIALARTASVEEVAALLWNLPLSAAFPPPFALPPGFSPSPAATPMPHMAALRAHYANTSLEDSLLPLLAATTSDDATASWRQDPVRLAEGRGELLRALAALLAGASPDFRPLHLFLGASWALDPIGTDLLRMAIVLCADHELNASSFTARCIASTGASVRAAVLGGLATLSGPRHGGRTARIETFWRGLDPRDPATSLRRRLAAGEDLPGFGHPLYPDGDARAAALLEHIAPISEETRALAAAAWDLTGLRPNIDFALVALRRHLHLPGGAAFGLFALGRCIGWIAHALEQRETGQLIRPRAVYTGPPIEPASRSGRPESRGGLSPEARSVRPRPIGRRKESLEAPPPRAAKRIAPARALPLDPTSAGALDPFNG